MPEGVRLSERIIPTPRSVSLDAQAYLALARPAMPTLPALEDKAGWHAYIDDFNRRWAAELRMRVANLDVRVETRVIADVPVFVAEPRLVPEKNRDKAILFFHGGALVVMGGECASHFSVIEAATTRCRVFGVDYRNPPDHPYPSALDDSVAVYRELLKSYAASKLVIT